MYSVSERLAYWLLLALTFTSGVKSVVFVLFTGLVIVVVNELTLSVKAVVLTLKSALLPTSTIIVCSPSPIPVNVKLVSVPFKIVVLVIVTTVEPVIL